MFANNQLALEGEVGQQQSIDLKFLKRIARLMK